MKLLFAAILTSVIASPCLAADPADHETPADALKPGVNEPRVPDTLKPNADQRIRNDAVKSQESTEGKGPVREKESTEKK